jgi:hypothetical protein
VLAHTSGDELRVLSTEIDDEDRVFDRAGGHHRIVRADATGVTERNRGTGRLQWHDGAVRIRVALVALVLSFGFGGPHLAAATTDTTSPSPVTETPATDAPPATDNEFIPENVNIGDCLSSMPRPNCGSKNRTGTGTLLTFGVLMAGTAFIGWRISRSVRARDRQQNA